MKRDQWTPELDARLRVEVAKGRSQGHIATTLTPLADGETITQGDVSWRMKRLGLPVHHTAPPDAAHEAQRRALTAAREQLAAATLADAINLRERLWEKHELWVATPDGPRLLELDLPDPKSVSDLATAITRLVSTHENLERIGSARSSEVAKSALSKLRVQLEEAAATLDEADDDT